MISTNAIEASTLEIFRGDRKQGLLAKQAGMDILLASGRNATQGKVIVSALVTALESSNLSQEKLDILSGRVQRLQARLL
jgi:hypothetical protein